MVSFEIGTLCTIGGGVEVTVTTVVNVVTTSLAVTGSVALDDCPDD